MDCGILICPTHNDAKVGPELNNISIGLSSGMLGRLILDFWVSGGRTDRLGGLVPTILLGLLKTLLCVHICHP